MARIRVLILGGSGMLGHKLAQVFDPFFETWVTLRRKPPVPVQSSLFNSTRAVYGVDAFQIDSLVQVMETIKPNVIVNCIGIVKQSPESQNPIVALTVNSVFPHQIAAICRTGGVRFIHISTDCVFSGKSGMYKESDEPDPNDLYGRTKLLGEVADEGSLTVRTSIIGRELETKLGLMEWFITSKGQTVKGYTNAIYSGFPTLIFARILKDIIIEHPTLSGLYHISSDPISKHNLLCLLRDAFRLLVTIEPFSDYRCDRSLDSSRFRAATGFVPLGWSKMIEEMAKDPTPYDEWRILYESRR